MRAESSGKVMTAGASVSGINRSFIKVVVAELLFITKSWRLWWGVVVGFWDSLKFRKMFFFCGLVGQPNDKKVTTSDDKGKRKKKT